MADDALTADQVRALLRLEPNQTCGFVRVTHLSPDHIAAGGLPAPFADGRPLGSALYFMVTRDAPVRLHRIRNDQLYHYYLGGPLEVLMLHADGSSERRLTKAPGFDTVPVWSPDDRKLAFARERDGNWEIYVMNADGSGQRNLTRSPAADSNPVWSPDGRKLTFLSKRDGAFEVYIMNADGSGQRRLTRPGT